MPLQPGSDAIVGGTVLRIPAVQSPNYVAGVSGWIIRADGSAEFNAGTFRGSIEVGPLTGQHFIVNNSATGDVVDVYNSSNQLVMKIDASGNVTTIVPATQDEATLTANNLFWQNLTNPPFTLPRIFGQGNSVNGNTVSIQSQSATSTSGFSSLALNDSTANSGAGANIVVNQGGTNGAGANSISGTVVQTANLLPGGNFVHAGSYNGTTDATGHVSVTHGAGFTPTSVVVTGTAPGGTFANLTCGVTGKTSTQITTNWTVANTGAAFANSIITFDAVMFR